MTVPLFASSAILATDALYGRMTLCRSGTADTTERSTYADYSIEIKELAKLQKS